MLSLLSPLSECGRFKKYWRLPKALSANRDDDRLHMLVAPALSTSQMTDLG
jgi:hypothetical protein